MIQKKVTINGINGVKPYVELKWEKIILDLNWHFVCFISIACV